MKNNMDKALLCRCGSAKFHLLENGMIECSRCSKHLNGGCARWEKDTKVVTDTLNGGIITFPRKPDLYETIYVDGSDGKRHTLTLLHEVS